MYRKFLQISFLMMLFSACVDRPQAPEETSTQALFDHTGLSNQCSTCHKEDLPVKRHIKINKCYTCHVGTKKWKEGIRFEHVKGQRDCLKCHAWNRPKKAHEQKLACIRCHKTKKWKEDLFFNHEPAPKSCLSCHKKFRPKIKTYPPPKKNTAKGHYKDKDCFHCHLTEPEKETKNKKLSIEDLRLRYFENGTLTEDEILKKKAWKFPHSNANKKKIGYCLPCHWTAGKRKHKYWLVLVRFGGKGNCHRCHKTRRSWGR